VKPFSQVAAVVFGLVAVMQLVRLLMGWPVLINGISIPLWASVIACLVAAALAVMVWRESRK
jgi:membrane associated rhomboid family serine protease